MKPGILASRWTTTRELVKLIKAERASWAMIYGEERAHIESQHRGIRFLNLALLLFFTQSSPVCFPSPLPSPVFRKSHDSLLGQRTLQQFVQHDVPE